MTNLILRLPFSVRVSEVMSAIGVMAGEPYETAENENNSRQELRFTGTQGPLPSLRTTVDPKPGEDPLGRAVISFRSIDGRRRNWEFVDDGFHPMMAKCLVMEDTPLGVAVGRRLCCMFGGHLAHEGKRKPILNRAGDGWIPAFHPGMMGAMPQKDGSKADFYPAMMMMMGPMQRKDGRKGAFESFLVRRVRPLSVDEITAAATLSENPDADAGLIAAMNERAAPSRRGPGL